MAVVARVSSFTRPRVLLGKSSVKHHPLPHAALCPTTPTRFPDLRPGFPTKNDKASLIVHHIRAAYDSLASANKASTNMAQVSSPDARDNDGFRSRGPSVGSALGGGGGGGSEHHPMWYGLRTELRTAEVNADEQNGTSRSYVPLWGVWACCCGPCVPCLATHCTSLAPCPRLPVCLVVLLARQLHTYMVTLSLSHTRTECSVLFLSTLPRREVCMAVAASACCGVGVRW